MKLKVYVVEVDLSPRQKKVVRAAVVAGAVIAALGIGIALAAGPIDAGWIQDGGPVSAGLLQGNLNDLQTQVTSLQGQLSPSANGSYSIGAVFCDKFPGTSGSGGKLAAPGAAGTYPGYVAAHNNCVSQCGSNLAHMCTPEEMVRSVQLGMSIPNDNGYLSTGSSASYYGGTTSIYAVDDCQGWTSNSGGDFGVTWGASGPNLVQCSVPGVMQFYCCE